MVRIACFSLEAFPGGRPGGFANPDLLASPWGNHCPRRTRVRVPPSVLIETSECRNINLLSIRYALRPRLRVRLTLRGLALRRNPWAFGDRASHPVYRYSCQHSHFRYLQHTLRCTFAGLRNAPLPRALARTPAASVRGFSPVTFSAQDSC